MPTAINKTPRNASDHWPAICGINSAMMPNAMSRAPVTRVLMKRYNDGISAGREPSGSVQLYPKVMCSSEYPLHLTCIKSTRLVEAVAYSKAAIAGDWPVFQSDVRFGSEADIFSAKRHVR